MFDVDALAEEDRRLWEDMAPALPRHSTAPTPGASHDLASTMAVSKMLGTPLMPWQKWTTRVATEKNPSDPKRFRYKYVVLTVPRQAGKTTVVRCVLADRGMRNPGRSAFYTAQTGKDASERWKDLVKAIDKGPLKRFSKIRMAAGSQAVTFINSSFISPFTPSAESLHGYTPHDVVLDEIFVWNAQEGKDLMGAIIPAQSTLPDSQVWLISTMGNAYSEFLEEWYNKGLAGLEAPTLTNTAIIDFGLAEGLDAFDPANWGFHPALGHRIEKVDIQEAVDALSTTEFERAYANRVVSAGETFIPLETWDALADTGQEPTEWKELAIAYDVANDGQSAAVVAAWYDKAGLIQIRPLRTGTGYTWLADYLATEVKPRRPRALGADSVGTTRTLTDTLKNHGFFERPTELTSRDYASACMGFKNHILEKSIRHNGSEALRGAIINAVTRPMGEGWAFSGAKSAGPIPELKAAVVAIKLLEQAEKKPSAPVLRF